jgi:hypothetical protein
VDLNYLKPSKKKYFKGRKTMKLSDLLKETNETPVERFGVVVDSLSPSIAKNISKIGLIALSDNESEKYASVSLDVLDTVIAYISSGVDVLLEVPYESNLSPNDTLILAMNCGMDLSILPPKLINEDSLNGYADLLCKYAECWLQQPNCESQIAPVSGYFQYLLAKSFGFTPSVISDDEYTIKTFNEKLTIEQMDYVKDILRDKIFSVAGGESEFDVFAHTICKATADFLVTESQK